MFDMVRWNPLSHLDEFMDSNEIIFRCPGSPNRSIKKEQPRIQWEVVLFI